MHFVLNPDTPYIHLRPNSHSSLSQNHTCNYAKNRESPFFLKEEPPPPHLLYSCDENDSKS